VDYGAVIQFKLPLLSLSFERLQSGASSAHATAFSEFCAAQAGWLDDYALFMAIKQEHGGVSWNLWERDIATRQPEALEKWSHALARHVTLQKYLQYLSFSQWHQVKAYANKHGIRIVGDAPIFVAYDSADVWANSHLFYLDEQGRPTVVAGVPPDYFSATGQRWGNPLYRWDRMAETGYAWWINRVKMTLGAVDMVRLDHFRGFEAYWEVPAAEETAIKGRWAPGPGAAFFTALERALGDLPIIAEDLGVITPQVEALRDQFHLPGMKVLQFAFDDAARNPYLPHNYSRDCVVYAGTHDNDTTLGWFWSLDHAEREAVRCYLGRDGSDIAWDLWRLALSSVADVCIVSLQDILRLGSKARMNTPGKLGGNWSWRFRAEALTPELARGIHLLTTTYGRAPVSKEATVTLATG
jgi:4-alpha-glucanotransferase